MDCICSNHNHSDKVSFYKTKKNNNNKLHTNINKSKTNMKDNTKS